MASSQGHPPGFAIEPGHPAEPHGGLAIEPRGGFAVEPPPTQNTTLPFPPAPVDIDTSDLDAGGVIDRVLQARKSHFSDSEMGHARGWMHSYAAKLPALDNPHPHPPDDTMVAQFLAVAPWPQLERLLYDLMAERKQCGYSYAWFTSVALQRIHGIKPQLLKQRREELKAIRKIPKALAAMKRL